MGLIRNLHWLIGWEYEGEQERLQIERQRYQRYLVMEQLKISYNSLKLKKPYNDCEMGGVNHHKKKKKMKRK